VSLVSRGDFFAFAVMSQLGISTSGGWGHDPVDVGAMWTQDRAVEVRDLFETLEVSLSAELAPFFTGKFKKFIQGAGVGRNVDVRDCRAGREGDSLLHCAARCGNRRIARFLVDSGCDLNALSSSITLVTPIMTAISTHNFDIVVDLVDAGARLDVRDFGGDNIFHYLSRAGSTKVLKQVVSAGQLSGRTAQVLASQANHDGRKKKLPENVASNALMATILMSYRETGTYEPPPRERDRNKNLAKRRNRTD